MLNQSFMKHAIALAEKGCNSVSPNPLVGAVIVKHGKIIGEGYHAASGLPHAERNALASCRESPEGATLYVTLEPCCHTGRTPPCAQAIIQAGIRHVVIGSADPNPLVRGKGSEALRAASIIVTEGFLQSACDRLNPIFFHYITSKTPYVALKYAMTADGKIATKTGASRWISNATSRAHAHNLRQRFRAILVGIGTVLADDPLLNCRIDGSRQPLRIICDSKLRLPPESQICRTAKHLPTIVAYAHRNAQQEAALSALGLTLWYLPSKTGQVDLSLLLKRLGEMEIDSVLVEGGSEIHYSFLAQNLAQKLYVYIAPKIFGGQAAKTPVGGLGVSTPDTAFSFALDNIEHLEGDLLLEYEREEAKPCLQD